MKKAIVTLLVISIITLSTFSVFPSLTAHAASGTSVYETSFESNATGWNSLESEGTITRTTEKAYSGNYSLKMSAHELTWMSPYMNLYNIFKSAGAGTYHFSMYVLYTGNVDYVAQDTYMMLRGLDESDENSFIEWDQFSGDYFKRISCPQRLDENEWRLLTGSVKVLDSDLISEHGTVWLCVDGLPDDASVNIYIDSVKVTKLADTDITNNSFTNGITGWRSWNETEETNHISKEQINIAGDLAWRYLRIDTYGSIATNVDQVLSYYGPGQYTLSFKIKTDQIYTPSEPFTFYFSTNFSEYHKWIGQKVLQPESGWYSFSYTITISASEFENYISPDEKEVHFRIQSPGGGITSYYLSDVHLVPKANSSFAINITTELNLSNGSIAKCNVVDAIPSNAPSRVNWVSSDTSIATVDRFGYIYAKKSGTITITATSRSGNSSRSISYTVSMPSYEIPNFSAFVLGQEQGGQCWAACIKMMTLHYLNKEGLSTSKTNGTLTSNIVSAGLPTGTPSDFDECLSLFHYYTSDFAIDDNLLNNSAFSEAEIKYALYNNIPIYANCQKSSGGHAVVIYGFFYNNENALYLKIYDPAKSSYTGGAKEWKYSDLISGGSSSEQYQMQYCYYISEERISL